MYAVIQFHLLCLAYDQGTVENRCIEIITYTKWWIIKSL